MAPEPRSANEPAAAGAAPDAPAAGNCLTRARAAARAGDAAQALGWLQAAIDRGDDFTVWHAAAQVLDGLGPAAAATARRSVRLAVLGSYTTSQLVPLLRLAGWRAGIALETHEAPFGQYRQEILDPASATWRFAPDAVLLAVHEGELALPAVSATPDADVTAEVARWTSLWDAVARRSTARIVQHTFALPSETPLGHLAARLPGSRHATAQAVNASLGAAAGRRVSLVDCERLAGLVGKRRWFDPRYWHRARQAVALEALPLLARHTVAVLAAELGLGKKCVVLDLDNTLWGGIVGEDGVQGIRLGDGPAGEAFVAFQEYLLRLKAKGIVLAVCSKNDEADAREPFERHPAMRLRLDDVAAFVANWAPKPDNLRAIAARLGLGLDALVFVDDSPAECHAVRELLPEVDVIALPPDPAHYVQALADYLPLETGAITPEDARRTEQYRARAAAAELAAAHASLEDFHRSLDMRARVTPFADEDLPRIAQLVARTNQFNLTARRHGLSQLQAFAADPRCVHLALRLRDRFADHGLVAALVAQAEGRMLVIDTWVMSCRVIGRTVEATMLAAVCAGAAALGCTSIRGVHVPTPKNGLVADLFARFGFTQSGTQAGVTTWVYDLAARGPIENKLIEVVDTWEAGR